jgi:hypothetical protein
MLRVKRPQSRKIHTKYRKLLSCLRLTTTDSRASFRLRHVFSQRFCRMKVIFVLTMLALNAPADVCRVLIDGAGCGTRQLAIHKILEKMPGVEEVTILPRGEAPAANQRYFIVRSKGGSPTREELVEALGRRARHYRILSVTSVAEP